MAAVVSRINCYGYIDHLSVIDTVEYHPDSPFKTEVSERSQSRPSLGIALSPRSCSILETAKSNFWLIQKYKGSGL